MQTEEAYNFFKISPHDMIKNTRNTILSNMEFESRLLQLACDHIYVFIFDVL